MLLLFFLDFYCAIIAKYAIAGILIGKLSVTYRFASRVPLPGSKSFCNRLLHSDSSDA
jgi:hypothetical protein